jgi:stage III sporulation protein AH
MTMGKRQLVLAALVVALGAAVYLNWALAGNTQLPATQALTSGSGRELGQTLLVNASGSSAASGASGSSAVKTGLTSGATDYFSEARLSRQKARDSAVELLEKVLDDAKQSDTAKKEAVTQAGAIAQNTLKESSIENLIKAKGYSDCVVSLENGGCNVVVKTKASPQEDAVQIKDIVADQAGVSYDKIKIVEMK